MKIATEIRGSRDVVNKIDQVTRNARKVVRRAVEKGATLQLQAVRAELKAVRTGLLRKSLGKVVKTYGNGKVLGVVGPRHGFAVTGGQLQGSGRRQKLVATRATRKGNRVIKLRAAQSITSKLTRGKKIRLDPTFYAHLVEGGAKPHRIGKGSRRRQGRQSGKLHPGAKAKPFLGPAWRRTDRQVRETIRAHLAANLLSGGGGE